MNVFIYCPNCGYYEKFDYDNTDNRFDVETHCGECGKTMVTHCSNPECPQYLIESLENNYCKCGTEYIDIKKTQKRINKSNQFPTRYI